jgi:uncharacterized OB-fold protein
MFERLDQSPLTRYRAYLTSGVLGYQFSRPAGKAFFPPRVVCPWSGGDDFEWRESTGRGRVYSFSWIRSRTEPAYAVVLVDMDEGFRVLSRIVGEAHESQVFLGAAVVLSVGSGEENEPVAFFMMEVSHDA